eukprot:2783484-Rhodomonas_salina.1
MSAELLRERQAAVQDPYVEQGRSIVEVERQHMQQVVQDVRQSLRKMKAEDRERKQRPRVRRGSEEGRGEEE